MTLNFTKKYNSLLIVDASYMIHRVLHNKAIFDLRGPSGERTGGVFAFVRTLSKEIRNNPGYFPVLCWDGGLDKRRTEADPNYKNSLERSNHVEVITEEELDSDYLTQYRKQRSLLIQLLSYAGIPSLRFNQGIVEGDDLMYILTQISNKSRILTDDRDLLQLVESGHTDVRRPMADELVTEDSLLKEYGYNEVYDFVINKAIIGDSSDNIPGCCKGIGGGTSINLIKLFYVLDDIGEMGLEYIKPENEKHIRKICEDNGIKFRKAMLNFDLKRYKTNLELIDLGRVKISERVLESIYSIIDSCRQSVDYFSFAKELSRLGIREISPDELILLVHERYEML